MCIAHSRDNLSSTSLHHTVLLVPWSMEVSPALQRIEFCVPSSHYPVCTLVSGQCAHHRFAGAQYLSFTGGHNICASYHLHWILCICKHCKMGSTQLVALSLKSPEERHVPLFEHSLYNICTLWPPYHLQGLVHASSDNKYRENWNFVTMAIN